MEKKVIIGEKKKLEIAKTIFFENNDKEETIRKQKGPLLETEALKHTKKVYFLEKRGPNLFMIVFYGELTYIRFNNTKRYESLLF